MAIESVGTTLSTPANQAQQAGVTQDDLFKILLTQLSYQDPLKPLDNQQFIAQLAQFTNLEQTRQLNDNVQSMLTVQAADQSIGLLGKTVEVRSSSGSQIGQVTTITFDQGTPVLTVQTTDGSFLNSVSLSQVFVVR